MAEEIQIKTSLDNSQAIGGLVKMEKQVQNSAKSIDGMTQSTQTFQQQMKSLNKELSTMTLDQQIKKVNKIFKETPQSVKTLTAEIEQYTSIAIRAGRSTPIGREFLKKAADAKDKLTDVTNEVNRLSQDGQKLQGALQGIGVAAGGFAIAQSGAALFGEENEDLQKSIIKVTAAMNVLQGVERIRVSLEKESALRLQINNALEKIRASNLLRTSSATATANVTQKAFATTTLFSNKALKLFRLALIGTGIGAIVIGIALLITNFDAIKNAVDNNTEAFKTFKKVLMFIMPPIWVLIKAAEFLQGVLQDMGVIDSEETKKMIKNAESRVESTKKEGEAIGEKFDFEIAKAKATGKETIQLEKDKRKAVLDNLKAQATAILSLVKLTGEFNDEQREALEEITKAAKKLKQDETINFLSEQKKQADAVKKAKDEQQKANDKAETERQKKAEEEAKNLVAIALELENLRIAGIEDGTERELAALDQKYNARIEKLKAGNEQELALSVSLEKEKARQKAEIEAKAEEEKAERDKAADELKKANDQLLADTELQIKEDKATSEAEKLVAKQEAEKVKEEEEFANKLLLLEERFLLTTELENELKEAKALTDAEMEQRHADEKDTLEETNSKKAKARAETERNHKIANAQMAANALSSIAGSMDALGIKSVGLSKAIAIGQIAIDTAKGIAGAVSAGASQVFPLNLVAIASGVASVIAGIVSAKKALSKSTLPGGAGGGGGGVSIPSAPSLSAAPSIPIEQLGTGDTVITGEQTAGSNQTVKAFVVETEITDEQAAAKLIEEKSELT